MAPPSADTGPEAAPEGKIDSEFVWVGTSTQTTIAIQDKDNQIESKMDQPQIFVRTEQSNTGFDSFAQTNEWRLVLEPRGDFRYIVTRSEYDTFDGDTFSAREVYVGKWKESAAGGAVELAGHRQEHEMASYKHSRDEDGVDVSTQGVAPPEPTFRMTLTREELHREWKSQ